MTFYAGGNKHLSFNPRVREGRDNSPVNQVLPYLGFNPRVREGRDRRC